MWDLPGTQWLRAAALVSFGVVAAEADTFSILSGSDLTGVTEWNSINGANVVINPYAEPVWKDPTEGGKWISYALTGYGQEHVDSVSVLDDFIAGPPTAVFYSTFYLPATALSGQLRIWADDTAEVLLDGVSRIGLSEPINRAF